MININYHKSVYDRFGWRAISFLLASKFRRNKTEKVRLACLDHPVFLSNYGADVTTLFQIFFAKEYNVPLTKEPEVIVDCGANIGLSAVYFAQKYPSAKIIAIEPDKTNFDFLVRNTKHYGNVICLNKAVWSKPAELAMVNRQNGNWAIQTVVADAHQDNKVSAVSLNNIIDEFRIDRIDLLKIDIEGAEKELFSRDYKYWLSRTGVLTIELHTDEITELFYQTLSQFRYRKSYAGENQIIYFLDN